MRESVGEVTWFSNSKATGAYVPATWEPSALPKQTVICIEASYVDEVKRRWKVVYKLYIPMCCLWSNSSNYFRYTYFCTPCTVS